MELKKIKTKLLLTLAIAGIIFIADSCKKEPIEVLKSSADSKFTQLDDKEFNSQMIDFRHKMVNKPKVESEETMAFIDALYMMEATFNCYHGFHSENYSYTVIDTIILPVNYQANETVQLSDLRTLYVTVNNSIYNNFKKYAMDNLRTMLFNLELKDNGELYVTTTFGDLDMRKSSSGSDFAPFDSTDYWHLGEPFNEDPARARGKCGPYEGQFVGISDAKFEQEKAARKYRKHVLEENYYFTSVTTIPLDHYILDFPGFNGYVDCFDPDLMNLFYDHIGDLIEYYRNKYCPSKKFVSLHIKLVQFIGMKAKENRFFILDLLVFSGIRFMPPSIPATEELRPMY